MDSLSAILREIARSGPVSRADLSRRLSLSGPAVTEATRQLLGLGLVEELDQAPSTGGRPPRLLGLVSGAATAIGIKLTTNHIFGVVVDLDATVQSQFETSFSGKGGEAVVDALASAVRTHIPRQMRRIPGIGVGLPGVVSPGTDGTVHSRMLGLDGVPLARLLSAELGTPILVDNDVNTLAVAESLYGLGRELKNFITVTIGRGIGLGIVINGEVHRGSNGSAEFGHNVIDEAGPKCECGNRGCIEAIASEPALVAQARSAGVIKPRGTVGDLHAAASSGDLGARAIYAHAAARLGVAVRNLVHVVGPQCVLISGEGADAWPFWAEAFEAELRRNALRPFDAIPVQVDLWDHSKWALGAAALILRAGIAPSRNDSDSDRLVRDRLRAMPAGGRR